MSTLLTRVRGKRLVRGVLLGGVLLLAGACTPQDIIKAQFWNGDSAVRVAECESGLNPGAVSPTNDHGLFQINIVHKQQFEQVTGRPWSDVYNSYWNTRYAKWLYDQQGWGPWACRHAA